MSAAAAAAAKSAAVAAAAASAASPNPAAAAALAAASASLVPPSLRDAALRLVDVPTTDPLGLGFTLVGMDANVAGPQPSGVFVASIVQGSLLHQLGGLHVGDQLVEMSGNLPGEWLPLRTASKQSCAVALAAAMRHQPVIALVVARNTPTYRYYAEMEAEKGLKPAAVAAGAIASSTADAGATLFNTRRFFSYICLLLLA